MNGKNKIQKEKTINKAKVFHAEREEQQPTKVFAKAGLDVDIIGCSSLSASVSAGR